MISVIVPIYNTEKYMRKCVDSIIAQTYSDIEIILVNDGSPDNCPSLCDEYASQDSRVKVVHKQNGGLADARNAGIEATTGDYLCFVDSDDYVEQNIMERYLSLLKDYTADIAIVGCSSVKEGCAPIKKLNKSYVEKLEKSDLLAEILSKLNNSSCNKLYKRELIGDLRFPFGKLHGEDLIFNIQYVNRCSCGMLSSADLYNYIKHPNTITTGMFSRKKLDEVYVKDWVYEFVKTTSPEYATIAQKHCFNSRMNIVRKIYKYNVQDEFAKEIKEYTDYCIFAYPNIVGMLDFKRKFEFIMYRKMNFLWKILIKIM